MSGCSNGTVTSVKIEAVADSLGPGPVIDKSSYSYPDIVFQGSTKKLMAKLEGTGKFDSSVVWSVKDGTTKSKVSEEGVLSISPEQNLDAIVVTATSKHTPDRFGEFQLEVINDPKTLIGKWVRSWKSFRDTIIIDDKSVSVKLSNGKSFAYNKTKWLIVHNEDSYYKDDYPGGFKIIGLFEKGNVTESDLMGSSSINDSWKLKEIPASFPDDYPGFDPDSKSGDQFSQKFYINKDKTKLCREGSNDLIIYDRVK